MGQLRTTDRVLEFSVKHPKIKKLQLRMMRWGERKGEDLPVYWKDDLKEILGYESEVFVTKEMMRRMNELWLKYKA